MYTEKSIKLKNDFYCRYGETTGRLFFEKVGLPCTLLDGGENSLVFNLDCGVRAYGRDYGDVLKIIDAQSNVCHIHFVKTGMGAQILYNEDISGIKEMDRVVLYVINKMLCRMGKGQEGVPSDGFVAMADEHAPKGWCAYKKNNHIKSIPLPINDYNVILIRPRKRGLRMDGDDGAQFRAGEVGRMEVATEALKKLRTDTFFEMIRESEQSIEHLLNPSGELTDAVAAARMAEGVEATRICPVGVIAFCRKDKTDIAVNSIRNECSHRLGYSVKLAIVK